MKRLFCFLLCIALVFGFSSCKDNANNKDNNSYNSSANTSDRYARTVYVSKSGKKVHSIPNCSGMKYYYEMSYSDAVNKGYDFCENCN